MKRIAVLALLLLAGCIQPEPPVRAPIAPVDRAPSIAAREAVERFVQVVNAVEPVAEAECRRRAPHLNCDYMIAVDDRLELPPNAFQTLDRDGRPFIVFTIALIAEVRNEDELALVTGHEAAHHIAGHLARQRSNANVGAVILTGLGAAIGATGQDLQRMGDIGANVGARSYSKEFEIEADRLGALIALRAGFDPIRGAEYFTRMPDPGNQFLGTHPPNAQRIRAIYDVVRTQ